MKDAAGRQGAERVEAIAWLASSQASLYLDSLDMPQSTLLMRCGWLEWAEEIIHSSTPATSTDQMYQQEVILEALNYLTDLKEAQHV